MDNNSEVLVVNTFGSVRGKSLTRPKELHIRITKEIIKGIFKDKASEEQFLKWLFTLSYIFKEDIK